MPGTVLDEGHQLPQDHTAKRPQSWLHSHPLTSMPKVFPFYGAVDARNL